MTREAIKKKLAKVRGRLQELKTEEERLMAEEWDADYAASTKIIERHHNTPEQLSFLNSLKEHEIAMILKMRDAGKQDGNPGGTGDEPEKTEKETGNYAQETN